MDYKRNAKYFKPKPRLKPILICAVLGVLTLAFGIGVVFLIAAIVMALPFFGKPSEGELDAQAQELMGELRARALKKLGLDPEEVAMAKPVEFWGYKLPAKNATDENGKPLYWSVQGKDGVWRSPVAQLTAFYFSENTVHFYQWNKALVSNESAENTDEIYYKDIVSVKMNSEDAQAYDIKGNALPGETIHFDSFALRNTGGESISCSVRESATAEEAVKGMRALLKTKKES